MHASCRITKPSLIGPAQTRSEREPGHHPETAAQSNAGAGYRQSRASRGSATGIRKRRRSATSLAVRGSVGEPTCSTTEGMGAGQARSRWVLMALDNHTRPANRTDLNRAMSLAKARHAADHHADHHGRPAPQPAERPLAVEVFDASLAASLGGWPERSRTIRARRLPLERVAPGAWTRRRTASGAGRPAVVVPRHGDGGP